MPATSGEAYDPTSRPHGMGATFLVRNVRPAYRDYRTLTVNAHQDKFTYCRSRRTFDA